MPPETDQVYPDFPDSVVYIYPGVLTHAVAAPAIVGNGSAFTVIFTALVNTVPQLPPLVWVCRYHVSTDNATGWYVREVAPVIGKKAVLSVEYCH